MSDVEFTAPDRRSEPIASTTPEMSNDRRLVMRPESFFSHRFHMQVEEDTAGSPPAGRSWLERLIDLNLVLMILLIGVPVLLYCILSSAGG